MYLYHRRPDIPIEEFTSIGCENSAFMLVQASHFCLEHPFSSYLTFTLPWNRLLQETVVGTPGLVRCPHGCAHEALATGAPLRRLPPAVGLGRGLWLHVSAWSRFTTATCAADKTGVTQVRRGTPTCLGEQNGNRIPIQREQVAMNNSYSFHWACPLRGLLFPAHPSTGHRT